MKETTPANKKTRKAFNPHSSTHHRREKAASGANTSTDPLGAYKLPELPKVELPELPKLEAPELPQLPDPAQLLADNKAHLEEVTRLWDEYNKPENVRARAEKALADMRAYDQELLDEILNSPEFELPDPAQLLADEQALLEELENAPKLELLDAETIRAYDQALLEETCTLSELEQLLGAPTTLAEERALLDELLNGPELELPDLETIRAEDQALLEELAEHDTALVESLDTQGGELLLRPIMLEAALIYARAGWRVLPCRAKGAKAKAPHITKWQHNATTDPSTVKRWWNKWPTALIGIMVPDDIAVIDIDPRNGGSIQDLEALAGGVLPPTLTAVSGGRDSGRHLYFKRPEGLDKSVIGCLPGIDVIVSGRFMIAPPSLHPDTGRPYRWENYTQPAMMPTGLVQALTRTTASAPNVSTGEGVKGGYTRSTPYMSPSKRIALTRITGNGGRNTSLSRTAFIGYLEGWAPKYIEQLRQEAINNGLSAKEVDNTLKSARKKAREIQAGGGAGDAR